MVVGTVVARTMALGTAAGDVVRTVVGTGSRLLAVRGGGEGFELVVTLPGFRGGGSNR